jgi:putative lipoprotein
MRRMRVWIALAVSLVCCMSALRVRADDDAWLGPDKALHFGVSTAIASGSYAGSALLLDPAWQRALAAAGLTLSVGAGKELYDAGGHGDPSWRDFTWDVLGCAVGVGVALLIDLALRPPPRAAASHVSSVSLRSQSR